VIADGSPVPLVVRKDGEFYLLDGSCWRIVAKVSSWKDMLVGEWEDGSETKTRYTGINGDPGFSDTMRGRVGGNPAFVRDESIWQSAREEFRLHQVPSQLSQKQERCKQILSFRISLQRYRVIWRSLTEFTLE